MTPTKEHNMIIMDRQAPETNRAGKTVRLAETFRLTKEDRSHLEGLPLILEAAVLILRWIKGG